MQSAWTTATVIAHPGRIPTHFFAPAVSAYIWQLWPLGRQFWRPGTHCNYSSMKSYRWRTRSVISSRIIKEKVSLPFWFSSVVDCNTRRTKYRSWQIGSRMDLKERKENLKGFLSSHNAEWSKCPAKKALTASLGHKDTKPLIISILLGFRRC